MAWPSSAQNAASAVALSPVMSLRKPGRKTTVGLLPSSRAQASSTPSPRSSRPVVSIMSDPEEQPVQRPCDVVAMSRQRANGVPQSALRQRTDQRQRDSIALLIMIDQRQRAARGPRKWPDMWRERRDQPGITLGGVCLQDDDEGEGAARTS